MDLTNIPTLVAVPFASGAGAGYINPIPVASQIPVTPGAASYTDGFVPVNFQPIASGGVPPFGKDMNGIFNALSVANRWSQAGGRYYFDATFSTAVTGYPKGATLNRTDNLGAWISTVDNNTTDPNSISSAGWVPVRANAVAVSIAVSAGANTPTKEKLGSQVIVCTGLIASAATLVLPLTAGSVYVVRNNTTGAGALTVVGATGSGVTIPQTVGYYVYTDGTNFYGASADVSGLYLPVNGTAVAATKLAGARTFSITGGVTAADVSFDGTGNVNLNVTAIPGNAATAAKWAGSITLTLDGIATGTTGIDGSSNVTLTTAIADAALSIAKTSGLQVALDAKAPLASPEFTGNVGIGTNPTSVPGIGNPVRGANNIIAYNAGDIGLTLLTDNAAARTSQIGFGSAGVGAFDAGMQFNNSTRTLSLFAGGASKVTVDDAGNMVVVGPVTATGGFQSSDRRLKKNIQPRTVQRGFALKLAKMFSEWSRIADGVHDVGLVAQRVKAIASRYVIRGQRQGRKAGMLAIDKSGIALEASMDCALQLDEQAKTIRALLRRIEKLEKAR